MTNSIIGIDISKLKFDLCLLHDNGKLKHKVLANTAAGLLQLSAWLQKQPSFTFQAFLMSMKGSLAQEVSWANSI